VSNLFVQDVDLFVQKVFFVLSEASVLAVLPRKTIINKRKYNVLMALEQCESVTLKHISHFIFHNSTLKSVCIYARILNIHEKKIQK